MREAEERARASLGAISDTSPEVLEGLLRAGWGSAEAVSRANTDELIAMPGVGNIEAANRLKAAATRAAAEEEKRRAEEKARHQSEAASAEADAERT